MVVDTGRVAAALKRRDVFYPVLGTWLGREVDDRVAVVTGLPRNGHRRPAQGDGSRGGVLGAVGLFHVEGVTPEAPDLRTALGGGKPDHVIAVQPAALRDVRDGLSTADAGRIDAVAVGSPHFSMSEFGQLEALLPATPFAVPFYVCTGRSEYGQLGSGRAALPFHRRGREIVVDTCVVVTPILPPTNGVLMTNSGKFAHYTPSNTGYGVVYGSLEDCVRSAHGGRVTRDEGLWS